MKQLLLLVLMIMGGNLYSKEYNASFFGIKSDGITDNTHSIQKAIDYIKSHSGGTLVFYVGRYVTGTIQLKSRVDIRLEEGAVIVGSQNPYHYSGAIFEGQAVNDVKIYGKGVIQGGGRALVERTGALIDQNYLEKSGDPGLISFTDSRNIHIDGIHLWDGPYQAVLMNNCKNVVLEDLDINGRGISTSTGIGLANCKWVSLKNLFLDTESTPLMESNNQYLTIETSIMASGDPLVAKVVPASDLIRADTKERKIPEGVRSTSAGRDYQVTSFGANNDGSILNTATIQAAIDYVSATGGGHLIFSPGVYLTGTIYLKSDVTIHLMEGAELRGSPNPWDYIKDEHIRWTSLIFGWQVQNIGITGRGIINCDGAVVANNLVDYIHRGLVNDGLDYDRPNATNRPTNIYFRECENVVLTDVTQIAPASWNLVIDQCKDVLIDRVHIESKAYWNNDGMDIVDCEGVVIKNTYIDASDDALCFKSHDFNKICQNVVVDSCVLRSSASGLKFGTVNRGGFKNIKITNLEVFDTYRSAITIQAVDGGIAEDIVIDGVRANNVGNAIYIRMGDRWNNGKRPSIKNIAIQNVFAEIADTKADAGYRYEGPVEDLPRNISPAAIVGLPDWRIEAVHLSNIEIVYPGSANRHYAYRGTSNEDLERIPQMPYRYPEFSQFKELPAWGFYVRHADDITFENLVLRTKEPDYRPAFVFDDARNIDFINTEINGDEVVENENIISHNSTIHLK